MANGFANWRMMFGSGGWNALSASQVRGPHRASLCTAYITKVIVLSDGTEQNAGYATGFLYRRNDVDWLVTCWHALTGRRPDDPGIIITPTNGESPSRIKVVFSLKQTGAFSTPQVWDLYKSGKPIWLERWRKSGVDLAVIPISLNQEFSSIRVQDAVSQGSEDDHVEIGMDVVVTGYPLGHGPHSPFPIWKKAMIASEPRYLLDEENPFFLIDTPGVPGMSGSPIYKIGRGLALRGGLKGSTALEQLLSIDLDSSILDVTALSFVGIYAGTTGAKEAKDLDHLNLGRAYLAGFLNNLIDNPEPGHNPFPPTNVSED
jgi:Trypsin-like peptidase domain